MRSHVEEYVRRSAGRLHPQIIGQFRQTVADEFTTRVQGMDRAGRLALLAHHGVRRVPAPEALDPAELLRRYVDARMAAGPADPALSPRDARDVREAEAEELSPRRMFEYLGRHDLLPTPLDDDLLMTSYQGDTGAHWSRTDPPAPGDRPAGPAPEVVVTGGGPLLQAPPSEADRRRWIAGRVSADDLSGDLPGFTGAESVTLDELRAAGIGITPGMDVEARLGGGVRGSGLTPLDQVRLLLARPGPWPDALHAVAAAVSRRIWRSAFTDFESTTPDLDAARTWDTALGLLLRGDADSLRADWRHAGEAYRDAVRRLADLLAAPRTNPRTVARLIARLRADLGGDQGASGRT